MLDLQEAAPDALRCPNCGSGIEGTSSHTGYSVARCACRELPTAEGVLVSQPTELRIRLLAALAANDHARARGLILGKHARKARFYEVLGVRPTFHRFVRHRVLGQAFERAPIAAITGRFGPQRHIQSVTAAAEWNIYMRHRFVAPPMLSVIALLGLLRNRHGLVLDAPCGMGHLSFLIGKLFPPQRLIAMDLSPAFIYSTRRFFAPNLHSGITHDMNMPLPLSDGAFGAIFCLDAFHYVDDRAQLAAEFMRILRDDGVCVLSHVHNSQRPISYAGNPLTPAEYASLFDGFHVRVVPEAYLVDAYVNNEPVDLSRRFSDEELSQHTALHVIAARSQEALQVVQPVRNELIDSATNPRLSGLYRMRRNNGQIVFQRRLPQSLGTEYGRLREILDETVTIPASDLVGENGRLIFRNPRQLLEKHVLVDVPRDY
jgi:SAM-dependent methyltransferase